MRMRVAAVMLAASLGLGCGGEDEPAPAPPPPQPAAQQPLQEPQYNEDGMLLGRVRVVDLDGNPVEGMTPIATARPNAFDTPISQGAPTDARGEGALWLPPDGRVFVRAWDPSLERFANNFYDVMPADGPETDLMTIQMVEGCTVSLLVTDAQGQPLANTEIELMMLHPSQGPWWPARGVTDATGAIRFDSVPAGQYGFRIEAEGHALDLPAKTLPPAGTVDFGELSLQ